MFEVGLVVEANTHNRPSSRMKPQRKINPITGAVGYSERLMRGLIERSLTLQYTGKPRSLL